MGRVGAGGRCVSALFVRAGACHILHGDCVAAATALRRGFAANVYIAEILSGNPNPAPLAIWHDSSFAEPVTAHDYMMAYGDLWLAHRDHLAFARWLFNHPKVLAERAALMECQEALLWEHDISARSKIVDQRERLAAQIDQTLSAAIVTQRIDQRGQSVWPWQFD